MENGDYIKIRGRLCKVVNCNVNPPLVYDFNKRKAYNCELIECNIVLNNDVLCSYCDFTKYSGDPCLYASIDNDDYHYLIKYDTTRLTGLCYIISSNGNKCIASEQRIIVLSVLQDFVRNNTGCELRINTEGLMNYLMR